MTAKPKTRKSAARASAPRQRNARVASEAEAAALEFRPWEGPIDHGMLPTNERFIEDGLGHLVTSRFALATTYKTKGELMEGLAEIDNEHGRALMNNFIAARKFFSCFLEPLDAAKARIIVAGSSYLQAAFAADRSLRRILRDHGRA